MKEFEACSGKMQAYGSGQAFKLGIGFWLEDNLQTQANRMEGIALDAAICVGLTRQA